MARGVAGIQRREGGDATFLSGRRRCHTPAALHYSLPIQFPSYYSDALFRAISHMLSLVGMRSRKFIRATSSPAFPTSSRRERGVK